MAKKATDKNWIAEATSKNKGKLREALNAKPGKPISAKKLDAAAKKGGTLRKEANLAKTLKKLHK